MVLKVYVSGMSGNKEVKKRQQRVMMILDSKNIKYEIIDITEPGRESDKEFMQNKSTSNGATVSDPEPRHALPPQLFNDEGYCGDYDAFDLANEIDTLEQFLKLTTTETITTNVSNAQVEAKQENGEANGENVSEKENDGSEPNKEDETAEKPECKRLLRPSAAVCKASGTVNLIMKVSIKIFKYNKDEHEKQISTVEKNPNDETPRTVPTELQSERETNNQIENEQKSSYNTSNGVEVVNTATAEGSKKEIIIATDEKTSKENITNVCHDDNNLTQPKSSETMESNETVLEESKEVDSKDTVMDSNEVEKTNKTYSQINIHGKQNELDDVEDPNDIANDTHEPDQSAIGVSIEENESISLVVDNKKSDSQTDQENNTIEKDGENDDNIDEKLSETEQKLSTSTAEETDSDDNKLSEQSDVIEQRSETAIDVEN